MANEEKVPEKISVEVSGFAPEGLRRQPIFPNKWSSLVSIVQKHFCT
jgi:hypothetical protein